MEKIQTVNPNATMYGVDISSTMVDHCRERGFHNVQVGSGNALEYPNEMFDSVFAGTWVMKYLDRDKALSEMHRVLKPGGIIAFDLPFVWGHGFCTLLRNKLYLPKNAYLKLDGRFYPNWKHILRKKRASKCLT